MLEELVSSDEAVSNHSLALDESLSTFSSSSSFMSLGMKLPFFQGTQIILAVFKARQK